MFLEKKQLIVTHIVKKLSAFIEPGVSTPFSQNPPLDSVLSQLNPVVTITPNDA
jgi:hypothetical protein